MELVPLGVVTIRSTVLTVSAGLIAFSCVSDTKVKPAAGVGPNVTAVAPVKLIPLIVTEVPPAAGPLFGVTDRTVADAGGGLN